MEILLTVLMGISLSAASGFRIFVPFLVISIAASSGNLELSDSFSWIGTTPALITFSIATLLEVAGYFIPWVDNLLDTIASPAAVIAGIILMGSVITGMTPLLKWTVSIIAGGGAAATIQAFTGMTRAASSTTTAGLGNPAVSTFEFGSSLGLALLAIFFPLIAAVIVIMVIIWIIKVFGRRIKNRQKKLVLRAKHRQKQGGE